MTCVRRCQRRLFVHSALSDWTPALSSELRGDRAGAIIVAPNRFILFSPRVQGRDHWAEAELYGAPGPREENGPGPEGRRPLGTIPQQAGRLN